MRVQNVWGNNSQAVLSSKHIIGHLTVISPVTKYLKIKKNLHSAPQFVLIVTGL